MRLFIDARRKAVNRQTMEVARRSGATVALIATDCHTKKEPLCNFDFGQIDSWAESSVWVMPYDRKIGQAHSLVRSVHPNDVLITDDYSLGRLFMCQDARVITSNGRALEGSPEWIVEIEGDDLEGMLVKLLTSTPPRCSSKSVGGLPPLVPYCCSPIELKGPRERTVFIDADSCPSPETIASVAQRRRFNVIAVTRQRNASPVLFNFALGLAIHSSDMRELSVMVIRVGKAPHEADQVILELARENDVIITDDTGLEVRALRMGCVTIDSRGFVLDSCMFRPRATVGSIRSFRKSAGTIEVGRLVQEDLDNRDNALCRILSIAG